MNKKGFTLVEIIIVISLLGLVIIITSTNVLNGSNKAKEKLLQTKIENIEKAAVLYGQDNRGNFTEDRTIEGISECLTKYCNGKSNCYCYYYKIDTNNDGITDNYKTKISIDLLVQKGYIDYDEGNIIKNPTDDSDMSSKLIQIYQKYGKIYADYIE